MRTTIESLADDALRQIRDHEWELTPAERNLVTRAAADLAAAVRAPEVQEALPPLERLEHLREALAVLAKVHGHLAWFLSSASTVLVPLLQWRALPAEPGHAFGTIEPTPAQYTEAEDAARHLQAALTRLTAT
ncbi:hypothetical protein [Streptomyces achromogenes]|uniref:hypothetical protein n=1 Tax=Streptomyces achromogenes TaxID=67255 RepID=UPI00369567DA